MESFINNVVNVFGTIASIIFIGSIVSSCKRKEVDIGDMRMFVLYGTLSLLAICWWLR